MTLGEIYLKAMILLGYIKANGEISGHNELQKQSVAIVNQIYAELFYLSGGKDYKAITSSNDVIDLPERILYDVMPYGVAMLIAQSENDGDSQALYSSVYNKKRASIRAQNTIQDVMPKGSDF